jgi:hypothetical protein
MMDEMNKIVSGLGGKRESMQSQIGSRGSGSQRQAMSP